MSLIATPESSRGIMGAVRGALGLFGDTNKAGSSIEAIDTIPQDEYESSMKEEDIVRLISEWKKTYSVYYKDIDESQKLSYDYWIGKQKVDGLGQIQASDKTTDAVVDNLIFEAVETFLPIATRANPDPLVNADPSELGQKLAKNIKSALVKWADDVKLRRRLARMTRHWVLYRIGVAKVYWDVPTKSIKVDIVNPRRMIFDKDGYIDEGGKYRGEYIGEKKKATAAKLVEMFPNKATVIKLAAGGKLGTKLEYYEWWYRGTDIFYTLNESVLGKFKNPNWNYDIPAKEAVLGVPAVEEDVELGQVAQEEIPGQEGVEAVEGVNHMDEPTPPYVFLSVFNTGLHPHDDTSLILQNISIQDLINRRWRQIDSNVQSSNNGIVVDGRAFTEDQAAEAASSLRRGVAIRVPAPQGDVKNAVSRMPAAALPGDVYQNLQDGRNELRGIFGTSGSTPQSVQKEDTVRGKILVNQQDSSRIGGGVTEQIEQVADSLYNWVVQLMFVYYDEEHFITTAGATGGMELVAIKNTVFPLLKTLDVTVKEGSLVPKDPLTKRNEAIDLWSANAIDPLNFYKALDFPDPVQATTQLLLWKMFQKGVIPPQSYLPSFSIPGMSGPPGQPGQLPTGTGDEDVNNLDASSPAGNISGPMTPEAVQTQSADLLNSVPVQ